MISSMQFEDIVYEVYDGGEIVLLQRSLSLCHFTVFLGIKGFFFIRAIKEEINDSIFAMADSMMLETFVFNQKFCFRGLKKYLVVFSMLSGLLP